MKDTSTTKKNRSGTQCS